MTRDIGFAVTLLRQAEGLTQRELARRVRTSRPHLCRIEIGEYEPKIDSILRLAHGLKVPVWVLLRFAESRQEVRP
jgi:transcriptional regulator with XRE-family HTH domain